MSPDGTKIAVGSHDCAIYIVSATDLSTLATCKAHHAAITAVDWTTDGTHIKSSCNAYELLWHDTETGEQNKSPSSFKDTEYCTNTTKFGWSVDGIFPKNVQDGSFINSVAHSKDGQLIVVGDDYGLVRFFRNPCRMGHKGCNLRGHSEHVVTVTFSEDSQHVFSVGGADKTMMHWCRT
jgi:WD40 repeat protein